MAMNLRTDMTFVEDEGWHEAARHYEDFLDRHKGRRVLFLELGVGGNTPVIIRRRTVCIEGDIGEILSRVRRARICQQAGA